MKFKQYDVVRRKALHVRMRERTDEFNLRQPVVGDVATIVDGLSEAPGYELECSARTGITQWMLAFGPDDVELELVE